LGIYGLISSLELRSLANMCDGFCIETLWLSLKDVLFYIRNKAAEFIVAKLAHRYEIHVLFIRMTVFIHKLSVIEAEVQRMATF